MDDSEVPVDFLIENIVSAQLVGNATDDGLKFDGIAEQDDVDEHQGPGEDPEHEGQKAGPSKIHQSGRVRYANSLYNSDAFWRHDGYSSDADEGGSEKGRAKKKAAPKDRKGKKKQ